MLAFAATEDDQGAVKKTVCSRHRPNCFLVTLKVCCGRPLDEPLFLEVTSGVTWTVW